MKKTFNDFVLPVVMVLALLLTGCHDYETYAEMKEKEYKNINEFIKDNDIQLITYEQFCAQDSMTDVSKNEYVPITVSTTSGACDVFMQIVRKGEGRYQRKGENRNMLVRYYEYSIADRDTVMGNLYAQTPTSSPASVRATPTVARSLPALCSACTVRRRCLKVGWLPCRISVRGVPTTRGLT